VDSGLTGKVAMVAGASRGLGRAVARALAVEGAAVSIGSRDKASIAGAGADIAKETGAKVLAVEADVRTAEALEAWHAQTVAKFGGVDLLFVNTGGPSPGAALSFDDEGWQRGFELVVLSAVRMIRLAVPSMRSRGSGAIVISTSSSVKEPIANLALSNVLRASVAALSKTLANELAPDRIRVNHLVPGRIDTDRVRELDALRSRQTGATTEEVRASQSKAIPLGRYGAPDEFAAAAVFLFSDAARYITGATLQVDGGLIRSVL
jgi:3-oxoacyl-[acyl-carrier protein] reductase